MKTLEELKKEFEENVYSLMFEASVVDGVRILHEDAWPIEDIGEMFVDAVKEARDGQIKSESDIAYAIGYCQGLGKPCTYIEKKYSHLIGGDKLSQEEV